MKKKVYKGEKKLELEKMYAKKKIVRPEGYNPTGVSFRDYMENRGLSAFPKQHDIPAPRFIQGGSPGTGKRA